MATITDLVFNDYVKAASSFGLRFDEQPPLDHRREWATDVVTYAGMNEQRNQLRERPRRRWNLNFNILDDAARNAVVQFFDRARGRYYNFKYTDRYDYEVELTECSVTAVGGETTTQLIKTYYPGEDEEWDEDRKDIVPGATFPPVVKIDAATKTEGTHFTLDDDTGIIDWSGGSSPVGSLGAGEVVTANFQFYFRVRFDTDEYEDIRDSYEYFRYNGIPLIEDIIT